MCLGLMVWSPLAAGVLTGKYDNGVPKDSRLGLPGYEWLRDDPLQEAAGKKLVSNRLFWTVRAGRSRYVKASTAQL